MTKKDMLSKNLDKHLDKNLQPTNDIISNTVMIKKEEKTKFLVELSKYTFDPDDFKELLGLMICL